MPTLLFSKRRIYELRDLIDNVKRPRRIDVLLNQKKPKKEVQCIFIREHKDDTKSQGDNTQPTLESTLNDKKSLVAFHTFLQTEFSEENIEFWLACQQFKETISTDELSSSAKQIYQDFIHPKARRQVNVDYHIRKNIQASLEDPSPSCFDEAQKHIYQLMERDSYPRFLRSDRYMSLRRKTKTMWYI